MAEDRDYYEILGIDRNADAEAIKSAYRKLAKKYHPDLHPGDTDAEKHFKEVNEAYSVLSDPDKKAKYDQFGKAAFDPTAGAGGGYSGGFTDFGDLGDIFGSIFGGAFGGGTTSRRTGPQRGEDVQVRLTLSFEEAVAGCKKEVNYARLHKCRRGSRHCRRNLPGMPRIRSARRGSADGRNVLPVQDYLRKVPRYRSVHQNALLQVPGHRAGTRKPQSDCHDSCRH